MAVQKAWIEVEPAASIGDGGKITCLFNPEELSLSKSANWNPSRRRGQNAPELTFDSGGSGSLSIDLVLDTTETGDAVTTHTDLLLRLMEVSDALPSQDADVKRPPWVRFHWGDWHSFKACVASANVTFTYFSSSGVPLRARAAVTFTQIEDDDTWLAQNPTSGTPEPHRVHALQVGETLDRLADRYYNDPTRWRIIADANGVNDPLRIPPGTRLRVPLKSEAAS